MDSYGQPDSEFEKRIASSFLEVLVRAGVIVAMVALVYRAVAPFLTLMIWALILAVTFYPLQQFIAGKLGGRQGLSATLLVILGLVVVVAPMALLMGSFGDSVQHFITAVRNNALEIPAPRESVAEWPVVGKKVHGLWSQAHADLPALVQSMQPDIGDVARGALGFVAGIGAGLLRFLGAFIIAGIIMAFGDSGSRASRAIFDRLSGDERGAQLTHLSVSTIRAVALGVLGIAFLQAVLVGLCLVVAQVPWAGVLAAVVLVLGIAQVPALIVTLPAIGYIWWSGDYGNGRAIAYTLLLLVSGTVDNVLKPIMLGRGVEAPMPVILLGALGGMATAGMLGMFVGATLCALSYQIFVAWVAAGSNPEAPGQREQTSSESPSASGDSSALDA
jgi:predicted PurR-regulated permease PerM